MAQTPHLPHQVPIDAYGNGGFRFAGMSHRGSLISVPSGIWAWPVGSAADIDASALAPILAEAARIRLLLIGTGKTPWGLPEALRWRLRDHGTVVEVMSTGPAVRTYNIVLAEGRPVAAALIAVQ